MMKQFSPRLSIKFSLSLFSAGLMQKIQPSGLVCETYSIRQGAHSFSISFFLSIKRRSIFDLAMTDIASPVIPVNKKGTEILRAL